MQAKSFSVMESLRQGFVRLAAQVGRERREMTEKGELEKGIHFYLLEIVLVASQRGEVVLIFSYIAMVGQML